MTHSEIVAAATEAAVRALRDPERQSLDNTLTRDEWEAMYRAQCEATDEWAKRARAAEHAKAPSTLQARIKELEAQLAAVNRRLGQANDAEAATLTAARAARTHMDDCDHPDCAADRERTGYACCAGGSLARGVVKAIYGTDHLPGDPSEAFRG